MTGARKAGRRQMVVRVMAVVVMITLVTACGGRPVSAAGDRTRLQVTGYAADGTSPRLVAASARALVTLGVDGVNVSANGTTVSLPDSGDVALLRQGRAAGDPGGVPSRELF